MSSSGSRAIQSAQSNPLEPDLIVLGKRTADHAKALDQSGNDALEDDLKGPATCGELFNKQAQATARKYEISGKIAALSDVAQDKGKALVIMINGPKI